MERFRNAAVDGDVVWVAIPPVGVERDHHLGLQAANDANSGTRTLGSCRVSRQQCLLVRTRSAYGAGDARIVTH